MRAAPRQGPRRGLRLVVAIAVIAVVVYAGARFFAHRRTEALANAYSLSIATGLDRNVRVDVQGGRLNVVLLPQGTADPRPAQGLAFAMALNLEQMKRLVDAMGGILINIPETIEYRGEDGLPVRIDAGMRRLDADRVEAYFRRPRSSANASLRAIVLGIASRGAELTASGVNLAKLLDAALDESSKGADGGNAARLAGLLTSCTHLGPTDIVVEAPGAADAQPTVAPESQAQAAASPEIPATPATPAAPAPTGPLKVRILNGIGRPGLAARAATKLPGPRYVVVETANADRFGYAGTIVASTSPDMAQEVIGALGLGRYEQRAPASGADVEVILGADMRNL